MAATADANALGRYLRVRRALARPGAAGVPGQGNRRVPGLRREEVAFLAGVSSDYYVRLEQGRDRHPSDQVLLAIARALQLDEDATGYLLELAKPPISRSKRTRAPEKVSDRIRSLITSWPLTPAYVHGKYMDILAANALATALCPFITPGRNAILDAFTEPEMRELRPDWDAMTARAVPHLRSIAGADTDDPRLVELVGELSLRSERFRTLWARQDVKHKTTGTSLFNHPQAGPLELNYEMLLIPGSGMQSLVTYHAEPGSDSEERLRLLDSITTSAPAPPQRASPHTPATER
ncbi:XRE family transcriptional regulator [Trebonia kvetii]|uniref:XRE family transcriptional regulator n=1 Tax=Trebonia kvetii TaxID=2480626 RepID=A0A6P2C0G0_9ACTN|nr:helix-turn-helix transcriptional regulator [Trebonia kvetii]TVZ04620.1 XRE family transcriptional regulator [Trebonia kvetii]